jgi:hypothetical protein
MPNNCTLIYECGYVNIPEAELTESRRRINATKWPEREAITNESQGVQCAGMRSSLKTSTTHRKKNRPEEIHL